MIVAKFGGTSLATPACMERACKIIVNSDRVVGAVVCSALAGTTDQLLAMARVASQQDSSYHDVLTALQHRHREMARVLVPENHCLLRAIDLLTNELADQLQGAFLLGELSPRTQDAILGFGERLASLIFCKALSQYMPCEFVDAREIIRTDPSFGRAQVLTQMTKTAIQARFANKTHPLIVTGFTGSTEDGIATTLGRGGSDYTAALLADALAASEIVIWTDVDGFMTADPRHVPEATTIPLLAYGEALTLARFGAKVIYPPTLFPAMKSGIPIRVCNSMRPKQPGSLIQQSRSDAMPGPLGVTSLDQILQIRIESDDHRSVARLNTQLMSLLAQEPLALLLFQSRASSCTAYLDNRSGEGTEIFGLIQEWIARQTLPFRVVTSSLALISLMDARAYIKPLLAELTAQDLELHNIVADDERHLMIFLSQAHHLKALRLVHQALFSQQEQPVQLAGYVG